MEKTVLITGASSGIGRATALYFAEKGWNVIAAIRNPQNRTTGLEGKARIDSIHLDVVDLDSIKKAFEYGRNKYGRIDVVVNNAGYALEGIFEGASPDQINRVFNTNVFGLMAVTREALPAMRQQKDGVIVNIASVGGRIGFPLYSLYQSTKWAVEGFSESLEYETRPFNIRIKIVEPGVIATDFYTRSMDHAGEDVIPGYMPVIRAIDKNRKRSFLMGSGPEKVAKAIFKAATGKSRRLRYSVGTDAKFLFFMRRVFPYRVFTGILGSMLIDKKELKKDR
jgi:NAD(P)-dependent dehydrogenase (short-subunit alcohol dehydrogenase family)